MSMNEPSVEAALLEIAKDLLQASDDLAATDPSASAKLAQEAYEIGRDLGIVRNHLGEAVDLASVFHASPQTNDALSHDHGDRQDSATVAKNVSSVRRSGEDDADAGLFRILDRQKAMLPKPVEPAPMRKPSPGDRSLTFESPPEKRSGWFGWMRSREWRHAG